MADRPLSLLGLSGPGFDPLDLDVLPGETVAVLGDAAVGAEALFAAVLGERVAPEGEIAAFGRALQADGVYDKAAAAQAGLAALVPPRGLTARRTPRSLVGEWPALRPGRVDNLLARSGIDDVADRSLGSLSAEQQWRVALARALAPEPRLLVAREPFAGLDAAALTGLCAHLQVLLRREAAAALVATRDPLVALALGDRIAVLAPGVAGARVAQLAPAESVYQRPATHAIAERLGPVAFLAARGLGDVADSALGRAHLLRRMHGSLELVVRPESVAFDLVDGGPDELIARLYTGADYRAVVRTAAGALDVAMPAGPTHLPLGARGRAHFRTRLWPLPARRRD